MTVNAILAEINQHFEDPIALEGIRARVLKDKSLSDDDRRYIVEQIGMYLADHDRGEHPDGDFDPDNAPEENGDVIDA